MSIPQNSQTEDYTATMNDEGGHIYHPRSDDHPRTFSIPSNATVPYPVGSCLTFLNRINVVTIAIDGDTLTLANAGTTGSRTLAANGIATAIKDGPTEWLISGAGLS